MAGAWTGHRPVNAPSTVRHRPLPPRASLRSIAAKPRRRSHPRSAKNVQAGGRGALRGERRPGEASPGRDGGANDGREQGKARARMRERLHGGRGREDLLYLAIDGLPRDRGGQVACGQAERLVARIPGPKGRREGLDEGKRALHRRLSPPKRKKSRPIPPAGWRRRLPSRRRKSPSIPVALPQKGAHSRVFGNIGQMGRLPLSSPWDSCEV